MNPNHLHKEKITLENCESKRMPHLLFVIARRILREFDGSEGYEPRSEYKFYM